MVAGHWDTHLYPINNHGPRTKSGGFGATRGEGGGNYIPRVVQLRELIIIIIHIFRRNGSSFPICFFFTYRFGFFKFVGSSERDEESRRRSRGRN